MRLWRLNILMWSSGLNSISKELQLCSFTNFIERFKRIFILWGIQIDSNKNGRISALFPLTASAPVSVLPLFIWQVSRTKKKSLENKCQTMRWKFNYLSSQSCLQVKESRSIEFAVMWAIKCFSFMLYLCEDFYFPEIYVRINCIIWRNNK